MGRKGGRGVEELKKRLKCTAKKEPPAAITLRREIESDVG